ncbi:TlpA family protein disulfide reductase [Herbaspirillum sp. AP02]|uniref:TlpA family protein disulfide reductase n=1 Tax=unclassified Herbaspirillum TaxID=2624150 RepID=UPI0015DB442C|nr:MULTISPECIES: TlpA disulfide reductase family protein [unclassified Herbaspirillum]MBG7620272.1 TlpA family protein disulfide reductase [Herbaspirillum sp. AP02]NZD67736.1 TlpA family protein disulfide reductase [Herbaspirillum sp. AP21]
MKKLKNVILLALVAVICVGVGVYASHRAHPADSPETLALNQLLSQSMPDAAGQVQSLAQYKGRPLVVNFWATWCGPCVEEMPELTALQQEIAPVQILGIGVDSQENIAKFAQKYQIRYPLFVAGTGATDLLRQFGNQAGGLPFTALVGKDGKVKKVYLGRIKFDELRADLSKL